MDPTKKETDNVRKYRGRGLYRGSVVKIESVENPRQDETVLVKITGLRNESDVVMSGDVTIDWLKEDHYGLTHLFSNN